MNGVIAHMSTTLARAWWLLLLRGIAAVAFGVIAWVQPGISLASLVLVFGAYCLADGLFAVWAAASGSKEHEYWWLLFLEGLLGVGIGVLTFVAPGVTALALLFYIAIWAIATGVLEIAAAMRLRREIGNEWLLLLSGLASVAFGVLLAAQPNVGALAVLWLIGSYAILFGVLLLMLAFKTRKLAGKPI